jgi:hypothetical protein
MIQALTELGESVYAYLGVLDVNLAPWRVRHDSPSPLMCQMNGWACGFFTIHAMQLIANGESTAAVTNEHTERIQKESLEMILNNLQYSISWSRDIYSILTSFGCRLLEKPTAPLHAEHVRDVDICTADIDDSSMDIDTVIESHPDDSVEIDDPSHQDFVIVHDMPVDKDIDSSDFASGYAYALWLRAFHLITSYLARNANSESRTTRTVRNPPKNRRELQRHLTTSERRSSRTINGFLLWSPIVFAVPDAKNG